MIVITGHCVLYYQYMCYLYQKLRFHLQCKLSSVLCHLCQKLYCQYIFIVNYIICTLLSIFEDTLSVYGNFHCELYIVSILASTLEATLSVYGHFHYELYPINTLSSSLSTTLSVLCLLYQKLHCLIQCLILPTLTGILSDRTIIYITSILSFMVNNLSDTLCATHRYILNYNISYHNKLSHY